MAKTKEKFHDPNQQKFANIKGFSLVAPAVFLISLFTVYPIIFTLYWAFHSGNLISPDSKYVGMNNFRYLFSTPSFIKVLMNTVFYSVIVVVLTIAVATLLAVWLNGKLHKKFNGFVQAVIFTPHIISLVSVSMVFLWLFDSQVGFLNSIITAIGFKAFPFFTSPRTALFSLVLVMVWKQAGHYTLLIMAALQGVPQEIYEAASIDDAPAYKTFFRITLPMISPTLFFVSITATISSFQIFDAVNLITGGGPLNSTNTLVYYIYEQTYKFGKLGTGSAASLLLLILVGVLTFLYFKVLEKRVHYQ